MDLEKIIQNLNSGKYPRDKFWMDVLASFVAAGMLKSDYEDNPWTR